MRSPVARLSRVDLPHPLGPMTAMISSSLQENVTSRSTSTGSRLPGNWKLTLQKSSIAVSSLASIGGAGHRLADAERRRVDQYEGDAGAPVAAIGPRVVGAALDHDVA